MKVNYVLPALQPETLPDLATGQEAGLTFRDQLRSLRVQVPVSWEQQLRLDVRPFTATYLGPPPRPSTLELGDAETQRSRWRNMLWRRSQMSAATGYPGSSARAQTVHAMLDMLQEAQQMEDEIVSQSVAVTRG